jgi:hypothetical protein
MMRRHYSHSYHLRELHKNKIKKLIERDRKDELDEKERKE